MAHHDSTVDFQVDFDQEWYLSRYIDNETEFLLPEERELTIFGLNKLHEYFSHGAIKGTKLLDVGTGPTIHTIISACNHVKEIYLSDYSEKAREILFNWLKGNRDLDKMSIEYLQSRKYVTNSMEDIQNKLRRTVKYILPMDITKATPFGCPVEAEYDVIISRFCLESACRYLDEYKDCAKKIVSLLKPGGYLILIGCLQSSYFRIGDHHYSRCTITREDVKTTYRDLMLDIIQYDEMARTKPLDLVKSDTVAYFSMLSRK